jgi:ATP-binding cassette subfamily B protein RaxB
MADGNFLPVWGRSNPPLRLVMQSEAAECALACLAMIASYYGHETDLASMRRRFNMSLKGVNLTRIIDISHALGFEARALRTELANLPHCHLPCVLHWDLNHFVVLKQVTRKGFEIYDPARGKYHMPLSEVSRHFTGVVLELAPGANFSRAKERRRISILSLTGQITGLKRALIQISGLAVAIEVLSLLVPFQIQWVIDHVLISSDTNVLIVLTFGFLILLAVQIALTVARAWIISWLGAALNAQWITNLFSHLIKLPLDYFEKRHMGDVVSRFSSTQTIQATITGGFVEAMLDGVMGSFAFVILTLYSVPLTCCISAAFIAYALLRALMYRRLWSVNEEQLVYGAKQQTELMESVRGIQAIKLAGKQNERRFRLANATLEAAKRTMYSQRITLSFGAISQGIFGAQRIILVALGAYMTIQRNFSAGMLIAFVAYADQFSTKMGSLIDKIIDLRMLRLHAERIADIALSAPEKHMQGFGEQHDVQPSIRIKGLSYRYSDSDPWIFKNLHAEIEEGETVAIVGPSGCGKSTLAKLILGLLEPNDGVIEVGGVDIYKYGLENYRRLVGAVMQDDQLFAGSIADNISFFDSDARMDDIVAAALSAAIHEDIESMPMRYESLVGDMGSSLSGGQKQRIILARALYRKPKILLLDEATSHLDVHRETQVNERIDSMNITRIVIAHRTETIRMAKSTINLAIRDDQASAKRNIT